MHSFSGLVAWHGPCTKTSIVYSVRTKLPAFVVIAAIVGAIGVPVFAGQIHTVCATVPHDCSHALKITTCCCDGQSDTSNRGGPVEAKVQLNPMLPLDPAVFVTTALPKPHRTMVRPHTSVPRVGALDLPTLFASLLI